MRIASRLAVFTALSSMCADLLIVSRPACAAYVVAVGYAGTIRQSPDSGGNWYPRSSGTLNSLYAVDGVGLDCWAVGLAGTILHSNDGGITWSPQASGTTNDLYGVHFVDDEYGWAAGAGTILATRNGGMTWSPQESNSVNLFSSVSAVDRNAVWLSASAGIIRHTVDGGANWSFQSSDTNNGINAIDVARDGLGGYAAVGRVGGSTDDATLGQWSHYDFPFEEFFYAMNAVQMMAPNLGWMAGDNGANVPGRIYVTSNSGESWQKATLFRVLRTFMGCPC